MRDLMYLLTQRIAGFGLFCYFREMRLHGVRKVPADKAVMFLANHQNALLDPLVIAAFTPFRAYFLTRSDVFINPLVNQVFSFLRMLPVYRMRDGRDTLGKNEAIFEKCKDILHHGGRILLFPEANHNIMRRVRPLSKGFTRILFATLDTYPEMDVLLVPVGINYERAEAFPDRVAFYFGDPISSRSLYDPEEIPGSVARIRETVSEALKTQTTHIEDDQKYQEIQDYLDSLGVDYLDPAKVNEAIRAYPKASETGVGKRVTFYQKVFGGIFLFLNGPVILFWKAFLKPRIDEVEFVSTYRFAYIILVQPVFYMLLWLICYSLSSALWASLIVAGHFLVNLLYVKLGRPMKV